MVRNPELDELARDDRGELIEEGDVYCIICHVLWQDEEDLLDCRIEHGS